ncbi:MAG: hypothetical protein E7256_15380 [Lachnospiraceae bacterium]|nr:hypothetical protein [Lachnospiraceae bacterium]
MKQKTVRFYEESKADNEAYEKLEHFREYGFNSGRELIIAAINAYSQKEQSSSGIDIDIEKLAELISKRIGKISNQVLSIEEEPINTIRDTEIMDKALSFMESL